MIFEVRAPGDVTAFDRLVGVERAAKVVKSILRAWLLESGPVDQRRAAGSRGILLFGPPGTGKTSLVMASAEYFACSLVHAEAVDVQAQEPEVRLQGERSVARPGGQEEAFRGVSCGAPLHHGFDLAVAARLARGKSPADMLTAIQWAKECALKRAVDGGDGRVTPADIRMGLEWDVSHSTGRAQGLRGEDGGAEEG